MRGSLAGWAAPIDGAIGGLDMIASGAGAQTPALPYAFLMRVLLLLASGCFAAKSHTATVTPAFEVASVKPAPPPTGGMYVSSNGGPGTPRPERYTAENMD